MKTKPMKEDYWHKKIHIGGNEVITSALFGTLRKLSVTPEELYQAFKLRLIEEVEAEESITHDCVQRIPLVNKND